MKKVNVTLKSLFIAITSFAIFVAAGYNLFDDLNYFLTKKETFATVLKLKKGEAGDDLKVKIKYFNSYLNKTDTRLILLENSYWDKLVGLDQLRINYSKGRHPDVYLADIESPHFGIIFLDLLLMIVMGIAFYSAFKPSTAAGSSVPPA